MKVIGNQQEFLIEQTQFYTHICFLATSQVAFSLPYVVMIAPASVALKSSPKAYPAPFILTLVYPGKRTEELEFPTVPYDPLNFSRLIVLFKGAKSPRSK